MRGFNDGKRDKFRVLERDHNANSGDTDHGEEAVPEHRGDTVCIDGRLAHQIEERVEGGSPEQGHPVNVSELWRARLGAWYLG